VRFFSVLIEITCLSFVSLKAVMDKFLKYEKAGGSLKLYKFSFFLLQRVVKTVEMFEIIKEDMPRKNLLFSNCICFRHNHSGDGVL